MARYRFTQPYASHVGSYQTGEFAEFDDDTAAWLNRDVAGAIEPADEDGERKQPSRQNRQVKNAPQDRGA